MSAILQLSGVCSQYGELTILNGIDFSLNRGETLCLLGASGCGKTTVLKSIAGLQAISGGEIILNQQVVSSYTQQVPAEKRGLGMLFQDYALFPHLTVADNVTYGLRQHSKAEKQNKLQAMLSLVQLEGVEAKYPHQLSGGQQQRVALARALACEPDLLLLDEPFSNIDNQVKFELIEQVRGIIKRSNVAAVFVTHSKEEAYVFADKIAVLNQGKVEQIDAPQTLYRQPKNQFVAEFMGPLNTLDTAKVSGSLQAHLKQDNRVLHFRPEHIKVSAEPNEGSLQGVVKQTRFVGSHYQLVVEIDQQTIKVLTEYHQPYHIEQAIWLQLNAEQAIQFA